MINSQSESSNPFNLHPLTWSTKCVTFHATFHENSHQLSKTEQAKHPWNALNPSTIISRMQIWKILFAIYNEKPRFVHKIGVHVFDHSFRSLFFVYAEHKLARVKVLNGDQWRLPMDSKHSSVTPTTESNLSSSTEEIQPSPIYEKGRQRELLYWRAPTPNRQILFCFSANRLFCDQRKMREREGGGIVDEMDFFFFFFNFLSIGWLERKNENFFCNIFFLIMIATFYVISLNNRYKLDWWFNDDIFLGYNMLEYFDKS